ncbi:hypothetical protein D9M68_923780 [compost metagenome]
MPAFSFLWGRIHSLTGPQVRPAMLQGQLRCPSRLKSPPQQFPETAPEQLDRGSPPRTSKKRPLIMSGLNRTSIKELSRINVGRWENGKDSAVLGVVGLLLLLGRALLGDGLLLGGLGA